MENNQFFKYLAFVVDFEEEFGCHVDVVTDGIQDKDFWRAIKEEEILLYEEQ